MEMAKQTKAKTKARTKTKTKTKTTRVQATVRAATGNGNLYTQNISTVKEHKKVGSIVCYKESSAAKLAEIQNNKTKIKISQYKRKIIHLKFLMNLYLKLILCISHIKKAILKICKTKTKTNFSHTSNHAPKCIINLQQKLLEKAHCFKTFSFKFKLVLDFLTRFHYSKRKNRRNYVTLTIRRHFVGICLKRLISLKRIQQIPENHNQIDESSLQHSRQDSFEICNYENFKENSKPWNDKDFQLSKGYIISLKHKKFMESFKALSLSLREEQIGGFLHYRYCQHGGRKSWKEKLLIYENQTFNKKCGQRSFKDPTELTEKAVLSENQIPIRECINQIKANISTGCLNFILQQFFLKCGQLAITKINLELIIDNKLELKASIGLQLQNNITLIKTESQEPVCQYLQKCGQFFVILKYSKFKIHQIPHLKYSKEPSGQAAKLKKFNLPKLFSSYHKCCQQCQHRVAFEHSYNKENQIEASLENREENCRLVKKFQVFKLLKIINDYSQRCGQMENCRFVFESDEQIKAYLRAKFQKAFTIQYDEWAKLNASEKQDFSPNSPQKYDQLQTNRVLKTPVLKNTNQIGNNTKTKRKETTKRSYNQLTILKDVEIKEFSTNSLLKCGLLNKQKNRLSFYMFTHDLKTIIKFEKIVEISKENLRLIWKHRVAFIVLEKSIYIETESRRNLQKKSTLFAIAYNQKSLNIPQCLLQKTGQFNKNIKLQESKIQNATENIGFISIAHKNKKKFDNTSEKQLEIHQKFCLETGLRRQASLSSINEKEEMMKLAYKTNIARQFLQLDDNNNSYQVESKQQKILKKCQQILYPILLCYICCSCYWHIYGFPLVLVKIFKYLKDATVNVLTQRLKITTTITTPTIATSMCCYSDGNIKAACDGKLNKPTKMADYKANEQNVFKRQTTHITTFSSSDAYSSSYCSTTSLTTSSSYCKSLKNLILLPKQAQQPYTSHCCQRNHHYHHQHQHRPHQHHYYQCNRQKQLKQQSQQQHQQQQHMSQLPQQYKFIATIHLQLPSLLVFSRTLIILMLLSSLWHTSEGFHGSGVKLSTNTVRTKYGLLRGIVVRSSPSLVEAYLGIPYASPPVGSLRFMPPITPSTWKNVRNSDRFSPVCPQNVPIPPNGPEALLEVPRARLAQLRRLLPLLSNQSEDCLYLNIYVPFENRRHRRFTTNSGELNDAPKLPAILFIHGESYEWNSGNPYDGSELAAHGNVIVVTINFRLGILGFLKTGGKESAQGNFGLMDLVAGLHWLKENLPAFGGDPQQITILGHGTGAALANILVVSPVASDLIQHTVMVSGSALSPWAIQKNPLFVKRRVAEQTGCHGDMLYYDLAPCLRTKTVTELLAVKIDHPRFLVGFAPFIDGTVISPNTDYVAKLSLPLGSAIVSTSGIEFANFPKRNLIFCLTSVESHLDLNAQDLEFGFNETRRDRILRTYVRNNFHYHLNEIFAVLKNEYTDWDKAIRSPLSSRDATLQFLSDGHTASSLIKLGYMHSLRGGKVYFLHFKHRTVEEEYPQRTGSVRGEDVPFWLGLPISPLFPHNYTTQEKQISRLMLRYLANFAKTGNPNRSSLLSPPPSSSSLIDSPSSSPSFSSSSSSQTGEDSSEKIKRSSFNIVNATSSTSSGPIKSSNIIEDVATAAAREALNLAVLYNQRRTKRTYYKRHSRSNDDHSGSASSEVSYFLSTNNNNNNNNKLDSDELPFWDAYDVVNQLYMELGNKAEIQSHYRGHKLSMWLNLIPQLHRHANMNDQSMRHHQFQDDLNNLNLYEGIVRAQIQTKPDDDDETLILPKGRLTTPPPVPETNATQKPQGTTTECGVDGAMFVAELTTLPPSDNRSLLLNSREKEMATASTGLIGNLEVLRRLSGKQFQSYTTALVATVAVGCFLLILNILIFAGIYHQREKRARDAKTKEELQDNDTSKNSSMLKLNAMGSETGSFNDSGAGVSGKTTVLFGEYSCYDEKSLQTKDEKLIVELPPAQMIDANWAGCSTSTLDLLKTKHHTPLDTSYAQSNVVPINTESQTEHLMAVNNMEMVTYNPLPLASGLIIDPSFAATTSSSSGLLSKRGSFVGSSGQLNQYDFASVQSSDQMSFKDIENAVKASAAMNDDITQDDDIPEPPPPPRSFQSMQQQQQQQLQQASANTSATTSGSGGGGILRQAGAASTTQTGGGKKRVHIQEISV